jgi:hypothetical protein
MRSDGHHLSTAAPMAERNLSPQVAKGERLLKDLYEALRAGKGWDKTMLWVGLGLGRIVALY